MELQKIWYRSEPLGWKNASVKAMEDTGSLLVEEGRIEFKGKKKQVVITDIRSVELGRQFGEKGRDAVNKWVTVEYGDGQLALFADGGALGWRGLLGGTKKLHKTLEEAQTAQPV